MEKIRILNVVAIMNRGGLESMIMNHYRHIDRNKIQFDFLVHRKEVGAFDSEIKKMGGKIFYLPQFNPFNIINYNKSLDEFFASHPEYKIVHSHYNALSMWVLRAARKANVPIRIAHSHLAYPKINYQTPFYWYGRLKINTQCTNRFACSLNAAEWLFGKKNSVNTIFLKNAIDLEGFSFNEEKRKKIRKELDLEDKLIFGNVGRFNPSKNHEFLLKVFNEVYKKEKNAHLLLVGDGGQKEVIEKKAKEMGLSEVVSFLGVRSDIDYIVQAMDFFLFPSKFEALPVTLIEAQTSGVNIIASDTITREVDFTRKISFLPIDDESIYLWKNKILNCDFNYTRESQIDKARNSGYDIKLSAANLYQFYLKELNNLKTKHRG